MPGTKDRAELRKRIRETLDHLNIHGSRAVTPSHLARARFAAALVTESLWDLRRLTEAVEYAGRRLERIAGASDELAKPLRLEAADEESERLGMDLEEALQALRAVRSIDQVDSARPLQDKELAEEHGWTFHLQVRPGEMLLDAIVRHAAEVERER